MNILIFYVVAAIFIYFIVMKVNMGCSGCNTIGNSNNENRNVIKSWSTNNIPSRIIPPFEGPIFAPYPQFNIAIPPSDLTNQYGQNENPFEYRQIEGVSQCYE